MGWKQPLCSTQFNKYLDNQTFPEEIDFPVHSPNYASMLLPSLINKQASEKKSLREEEKIKEATKKEKKKH
jgi:hypothetical protein